MKYLDIIAEYITLEFTVLALAIGFAITFLMALSAMRGKTQPSIRQIATTNNDQNILDSLQDQIDELGKKVLANKQGLPQTAIVRYNPFRDSGVGGNQSFSLASINKEGHGFILTHLFSRELSRVSTKHITAWDCDQELSPEEQQALEQLR